MITNHFQIIFMVSILRPITALPMAPGNTVNLLGTSPEKDDGKILQRAKRGWMWNQFFLLEEYTGNDNQYVGKLHSNMDRGEGNVKYILTGDGVGSLFLIDENSGDIHATKRLDREERAIYTLHAKVVDKRTNKTLEADTEFNIKIHDINDNEPKFSKDIYFASVPEMSDVGTSVIQVTATDADDQTYGNSAKLVYSILQGQPYFSVDSDNGTIRTALPNMDRETKENYQVVIQAKDMAGQMGGLSGTTTVSITLSDENDSPPRFANHTFRLSTLESAEVGAAIGRIKANDADVGRNAEMQYSIVDRDGQDIFTIITDQNTQEGIIRVKKQLDYERKKTFSFKVEVTNTYLDPRFMYSPNPPFKDDAMVRVTIEDVDEPPVFSRNPYIIEVHEDTAAGSFVGVVSAKDLDADNNPVKYSIDRHTDLERLFNIDSVNGTITTLKALDREMSKWHNISVVATEISNPRQTTRVPVFIRVLDVNDNAPEFAMYYETFVCENVKSGQLIQTISAVDTDEPLVGHKFVFSMSFSNPNFTIIDNEDNTARIITRRGGFSQREMNTYLLPVVISDNDYPIQSSTSTLTVNVCACDSRGNVQSCNTEALLSAGLSTGALVAILLCVIILLMIVVLFAALRRQQRKKEPLIISKEDVRDNVVSYNDEGGGEEDTQAFDIGTLRNPEVMDAKKLRRDIIPEMLFPFGRTSPIKDNADVRDFIHGRLHENDSDPTAPPYDSLATYAYEGSGSLAESLSSLESGATEGDQEYDYLSNWGPAFKKLADMYIGKDTERET
ncbi:cadherin-10-like [Oncorhynchus nerka]|uniref:Cadherin-10 n=2 Tax=Oncorhynchus TaxID=8016 RepID=A0A8C8IR96_ONCTS|nr:cadherin-10 [Oncorhynchus tshawytscha]XP_029482612.1 cadherin-10-like [Oncorhynchus nerka]XP_035597470.1 cadherin-10-like [Oncorhynchus keta]XP_046146719.1 cadherin-10-like [Oncorhynchus gorbuscha]